MAIDTSYTFISIFSYYYEEMYLFFSSPDGISIIHVHLDTYGTPKEHLRDINEITNLYYNSRISEERGRLHT